MIRALFNLLLLLTANGLWAQDTLRVQVHGLVVNANTEQPVLEALVEWYDADGKRQAVNQTNSEGAYAFFVATTGDLELRVAENGYVDFSQRLHVDAGESARELMIRLVPK